MNPVLFNHLSSNIDPFSSLTTTSPLAMIALVKRTRTVVEGIASTGPKPPSSLLTPYYYSLRSRSPFSLISFSKLISVSKLTRDLNCPFTFSDYSITLQNRSTMKMIGIGHELKAFFILTRLHLLQFALLPMLLLLSIVSLVILTFQVLTNGCIFFYLIFN